MTGDAVHLSEPYECLPFLRSERASISVGVRPMRESQWLRIDRHYPDEIAYKEKLLSERHEEVFACMPAAEEASREALELVTQWLDRYHADWFRTTERGIEESITGRTIDTRNLHPLDAAGRLVQEDFAIMLPSERGPVLAAATLCFPSRWSLREKLGQPMTGIHGRVPGYSRISAASDALLNTLAAGKIVWRTNWSIHDTPELFQPGGRVPRPDLPPITWANAGDRLYTRVELQTLRSLPRSRAILFGIHTYVTRIASLAHRPQVMEALALAIRRMPEALVEYKNQVDLHPPLLEWLDARSKVG